MANEFDECRSFGMLRKSLRHDLVSWHGFSNPDAGQILNWFDPANSEYLERVNEWQELLCQGAIPFAKFPFAKRNAFGSYDIWHLPDDTVEVIHQIAKLVYKFHGTPRKETNMQEVKTRLSEPLPITLGQFEKDGIRECLAGIRPPDLNCVVGRFGPGITFDGFTAWEKWTRMGVIPDVPPDLYRVNPRDPWTPSAFGGGCTKIAEVPKSIKCNRIVSSECAMYMYAQLAVADDLDRQLHGLFAKHVSLHDAEQHNQFLLRRDACSIDLSDASDHVSVELVQALLPQLWPVLAAVRSSESLFPDGEVVRLATFAPMGSGVCFPILTLINLGLCAFAAKCYEQDHRLKPGSVWFTVYGDDVIVPVCIFDIVTDLQTRSGLLVNSTKSCCTRIYRESCGREMYHDRVITPGYIRDPFDKMDASKVEQVCQLMVDRFMPSTAKTIADEADCIRMCRWNTQLQREDVSVRATIAKQKVRALDGWHGLNRWFSVHTQQEVCINQKHIKTRPTGVDAEVWTKTGWRFKPSWDYPYLTHWFATRC